MSGQWPDTQPGPAPALAGDDDVQMTPEARARELLDRMEVPGALARSAGDVIELANLIAERDSLAQRVDLMLKLTREAQALAAAYGDEVLRLREKAEADRAALLKKFDGYVPADVVSSLRWRVRELEAQIGERATKREDSTPG